MASAPRSTKLARQTDLASPFLINYISPSSSFPYKLAGRVKKRSQSLPVQGHPLSYTEARDLPFIQELRGVGKKQQRTLAFPSLSSVKLAALLPALALLVCAVLLQLLLPHILSLIRPHPPPPPPSCPTFNPFIHQLYCQAPPPQQTGGSLYSTSPRSMALASAAERVAAEFEYTKEDVNRGVLAFMQQMEEGLAKDGTTLSQIPTYVTAVPNGTEEGLYMAVDLGGTNFRVCSIQLHGNSTFSLTQSKVAIPRELMVAKTSHELFSFLARQIQLFLKTHHGEHYNSHTERRASMAGFGGFKEEEIFSLGFTFSFPVQQFGINKGTLIRWTKGFDIPDTIGKDVCALLQKEIDALGLPVRVAALVNDTVGTLMARSYTSPGKTGTLLGAIFGTGTNGAYVESLSRIPKLSSSNTALDTSTGDMIINTEWGSFDNHLSVLPRTPYDTALDAASVNPGIQMFEKRVSGMFLGEILRRALLALIADQSVPLFSDTDSSRNDIHSTTSIDDNSKLYDQWGLDTSFLSLTASDAGGGLKATRQALDKDYGVSASSAEDAEAVRLIAAAIGRRAARLSAVAIAAVVLSTGALQKAERDGDDGVVDVGVDGSLVEFYPGFEEMVREALREVKGMGPLGEKRVRIGIAKDGSGVGAALIALVAGKGNGAPTEVSRRETVAVEVRGLVQRLFDAMNSTVRWRV